MSRGRNASYNPRTGTWTRPKAWYDKGRGRKKKSGCYIATAVYGSYDCPEVWTLRRFRDDYLTNRFWGRVFIKLYYSVSPIIVKLFGKTSWFNKIFRSRLDIFVKELREKGFSSDRYEDK